MELLKIEKGLEEQMPLLVSGCMSLKGTAVEPKCVENLLTRSCFDGFDLGQVLDIANYSSAIEFIGECKEQKYKTLSGNLVMALSNFILRRIAVKQGFLNEGIDVMQAVSDLNDIFAEQQSKTLSDFIKGMFNDIMKLQLLSSDNEAMVFLIINFYLYCYTNQILIFSDISGDKDRSFAKLQGWVATWTG